MLWKASFAWEEPWQCMYHLLVTIESVVLIFKNHLFVQKKKESPLICYYFFYFFRKYKNPPLICFIASHMTANRLCSLVRNYFLFLSKFFNCREKSLYINIVEHDLVRGSMITHSEVPSRHDGFNQMAITFLGGLIIGYITYRCGFFLLLL